MSGIRLRTAWKVRRIAKLRQEGLTLLQIGERLGCSGVNVHLLWKRWGDELDSLPTAAEHIFTPLRCIQRRMALGWTTGDLARRASVHPVGVWQFENEITNASHRWRCLVDAALRDGETVRQAA